VIWRFGDLVIDELGDLVIYLVIERTLNRITKYSPNHQINRQIAK
jgi:hypothetical protein